MQQLGQCRLSARRRRRVERRRRCRRAVGGRGRAAQYKAVEQAGAELRDELLARGLDPARAKVRLPQRQPGGAPLEEHRAADLATRAQQPGGGLDEAFGRSGARRGRLGCGGAGGVGPQLREQNLGVAHGLGEAADEPELVRLPQDVVTLAERRGELLPARFDAPCKVGGLHTLVVELRGQLPHLLLRAAHIASHLAKAREVIKQRAPSSGRELPLLLAQRGGQRVEAGLRTLVSHPRHGREIRGREGRIHRAGHTRSPAHAAEKGTRATHRNVT